MFNLLKTVEPPPITIRLFFKKQNAPYGACLLALESELFDEGKVSLLIFSLEVLQVLAAIGHELEKSTT